MPIRTNATSAAPINCLLSLTLACSSDLCSNLLNTSQEKSVKNQNNVCSSNSKRSPKMWSPIEKIVKVASVKPIPIKNHERQSSTLFLNSLNRAPVKKTKANPSKPAATANAKSAMNGDSSPAEAKNF